MKRHELISLQEKIGCKIERCIIGATFEKQVESDFDNTSTKYNDYFLFVIEGNEVNGFGVEDIYCLHTDIVDYPDTRFIYDIEESIYYKIDRGNK